MNASFIAEKEIWNYYKQGSKNGLGQVWVQILRLFRQKRWARCCLHTDGFVRTGPACESRQEALMIPPSPTDCCRHYLPAPTSHVGLFICTFSYLLQRVQFELQLPKLDLRDCCSYSMPFSLQHICRVSLPYEASVRLEMLKRLCMKYFLVQ